MALRKASTYSKKRARPFTRTSREKSRAYIKTVPPNKVTKFHQGTPKDYRAGKHPYIIHLTSQERVQIRDNALESCRMYLTKLMEEQASGQFYLAVKVFPHHLLREHKLGTGAGADRLSTGMSHSYGIVAGRAAVVAPGQDIFFISCASEKVARIARDALIQCKSKVPCSTRIVFEEVALKK